MQPGKSAPMSSPDLAQATYEGPAALRSAKNECLAHKRVDQSAFFNSLLGTSTIRDRRRELQIAQAIGAAIGDP